MPKKGLSSGEILEVAERLVQERGYDHFSLRELAARLEVKPASLYNHIGGIDELNTAVALKAAERLNRALKEAVAGVEPDDAFLRAALAYRAFAAENPELYKALMRMPASDDELVVRASWESFAPMRELILSYGADGTRTVHFLRSLRAAMHGFIELTGSGFMRRGDVQRDESYRVMIQGFLSKLKELAGDQNEKV